MNKQELIKKYEGAFEKLYVFPVVTINEVLEDLRQLDEPQQVTIPQFVADWYEENKDDFEGELFICVDLITRDFEDGDLSEFEEWFIDGKTEPFQTLVNMHQFGYEVEKEKRYTVKIKTHLGQFLVRYYLNDEELTPQFTMSQLTGKGELPTFTRKELEDANFGWVFDCPGIEIEEVE
nr:MAG TPA: Protein of unknown function (DUF1642) [Caudoviricetes sp.]